MYTKVDVPGMEQGTRCRIPAPCIGSGPYLNNISFYVIHAQTCGSLDNLTDRGQQMIFVSRHKSSKAFINARGLAVSPMEFTCNWRTLVAIFEGSSDVLVDLVSSNGVMGMVAGLRGSGVDYL